MTSDIVEQTHVLGPSVDELPTARRAEPMGMGLAQRQTLVAGFVTPRVIEVRLGSSVVVGEHAGGSDWASDTGNGHRR